MSIDYTMALRSVSVINEQGSMANIVKRVLWSIRFFDTDHEEIGSEATVETYLDTDALGADSFTPYENVTQTQILQWAFDKQGGQEFLDQLLEEYHSALLAKLISDASYTEKDIELLPEA